jgi:hypothetical protein
VNRPAFDRRQALRLFGVAALAAATVGVGACGRKQRPTHPEGTDYPKTYPKKTTD